MPGCSLEICQSIRLLPDEPASNSMFPTLERWLTARPQYKKAITWVASNKDIERYVSFYDFLLCELYPIHKKDCFRYYNNKGPKFIPLWETKIGEMSADVIIATEAILIKATLYAYALKCTSQKPSWTKFRVNFWSIIEQAKTL